MKKSLLLLMLLPAIFIAQTRDTIKNKELSEVTISGVRADIKDPIPQSNLTKSQITKNYAGQDFAALIINKAPSLTFYSDGGSSSGYMYLKMRGIDHTRINFSLNGISMAEPEDMGFYSSNFTDFLSNVNSIQIQRGVGISPSGIGNLVGSVNFESPNLSDSAYSDVQTGLGSFNTKRLSVGVNTGIQKSGFAFYSRFSNTKSDGYKYHSGTNAHTFFTSLGYYGKKDIFKLTAFSGNSKNQMAYLPTNISDIKIDPRTNYLTKDEKDDFRQNFIQLQHTRKTSKNSFITSSLYHIDLQGQYGVLFNPTMYNYALSSNLYGFMSTFALIKQKFSLRAGINGYSYYRNHSMAIAPFVSQNVYSNRGTKNEASAFTKLSYNIGKLAVFADFQARTATFSYKPSVGNDFVVKPVTWTFFNPKLGTTYKFNDNSSLFASIGQMHREPTRNDMFAGFDDMDTSNYKTIGNLQRVKPEQVMDYELGYVYSYNNKFNLSTNAFWMEFKNQIAQTGPYSLIGLPLTRNLDSKSRRYGLELEYSYKPFRNLMFSGSGTCMKAIIDSYTTDYDFMTIKNVTPLLTPKWILNQSVSYSMFNNKLDLTGSIRYVSTQFLGNDNNTNLMVPEAFMLNGAISIRPTKRISLSLLCNNIMNKQIFNGGYSILGEAYYFIGAPRNYYVALNYRF